MSICASALAVPDVVLLEPEVITDDRGHFLEAWNRVEFEAATGCSDQFVQDNQSRSRRGVLRGLHYQLPQPQGKLVRVVGGAAFVVAVDLRRQSATFAQWVAAELSGENHLQLWIPPGFAHGFLTLADDTEVIYKVTAYYAPGSDRVVRWNDPAIGIDWPIEAEGPLLSDRDRHAPLLADAEVFN
jgi:dTDP-4-dehydrorhamnose 3,5-epimerase